MNAFTLRPRRTSILFLAALALSSAQAWAHNPLAAVDTAMTASPLDKKNCFSCHTIVGTVVNPATGMTFSASPALTAGGTYIPGTLYTITLSMATGSTGKNGFEMTAENATAKVGTFAALTGTKIIGTSSFIGHNTAPSGTSATWTFNYTSPVAGKGQICFYAIGTPNSATRKSAEWLNHWCFTEGSAPDTTAPVASVTSPTNNAYVKGTVAVTATATDNVAVTKTEFYLDGSLLSTVNGGGPSFTYSWNSTLATEGSHTLQAKAYDAAGNIGSSSVITVTVSNIAPVLSAIQATGISGTAASIQWTSNKVADSQVTYGLTASYGTSTTLNPSLVLSHSVSLTSLIPNTLYHYAVISKDGAGNSTTSTDQTFTTAATADTTAPTVTLTAPSAGATVNGLVSITATATDNVGVARVEYYVDGVLAATDVSSPYSYSWNTTLVTNAAHTLQVKAYDAANNMANSSLITVTVTNADTTAPTTTLTNPTDGATVSNTVSASATATDNIAIARVEWFVDGALATTDTTAPYTYSWDTTALSNGAHTIQAKAYDAAGNVGISALVNVTVSNAAGSTPIVITTQPTDTRVALGQSADFSVVVANPNDPSLSYQWYRDGKPIAFGALADTYTLPVVTAADHGARFHCLIVNDLGSVTTQDVRLYVAQSLSAPDLSGMPSVMSLRDTLRVSTSYTVPVTFHWSFNPTGPVPGAPTRSNAFAAASGTSSAVQATTLSGVVPVSSLNLTPGQYQLSVYATSSAGDTSATSSAAVTFLVGDFSGARIYPNPWRADKPGTSSITFENMTPASTIKIFTVSGREVRTLQAPAGSVQWDLKTDSGDSAASGIYLYLLTDTLGNKRRGKLVIIR